MCSGERLLPSGLLMDELSSTNPAPRSNRILDWLSNRFFSGLFLALPVALTLWIIQVLYSFVNGPFDNVVRALIAAHWIPGSQYFIDNTHGTIPGAGLVLTLILFVFIGVLAGNIIGQHIIGAIENILLNLPVIRSIYPALKQTVEAVRGLGGDDKKSRFSQVVYLNLPGSSMRVIGFVTGRFIAVDGTPHCNIFIPHAPSPLTGFVVIMPQNELVTADLTVEQAMKLIFSLGLVSPSRWSTPKSEESFPK